MKEPTTPRPPAIRSRNSAISLLFFLVVMVMMSTVQEFKAVGSIQVGTSSQPSLHRKSVFGFLSVQRTQRCAVVQLGDYHMDVVAGFAWAFQTAGCDVDIFTRATSYRIQDCMAGWFRGKFMHEKEYDAMAHTYDLIIFTTFPEQPHARKFFAAYPKHPKQRYVFVVHNPDLLPDRIVQLLTQTRLREAVQRITLATLGPWVDDYLTKLLSDGRWHNSAFEQMWMPALFPINLELDHSDKENLCMQGNIQVFRRDYKSVFNALTQPKVHAILDLKDASLFVVGNDSNNDLSPLIPKDVSGHIKIIPGLSYLEYYNLLSKCKALVTALAPGNATAYVTKKFSSTVATAINLGIPLVITETEMNTYQFLPSTAAFVYEEKNTVPNLATAMHAALTRGHEEEIDMLRIREELMQRSVRLARAELQLGNALMNQHGDQWQ